MDPFNKLPAELRQLIFIQLRSRQTTMQLIRASPVMLSRYLTSKTSITRAMLASDLDDEMLQDAMAIILYPTRDISAEYPALVRRHFDCWAAQELPNPLRPTLDNYHPLLDELDRFHSRLLLFVEDYLTKATAAFPPRDYLCIPELSSTRNQLTFLGRPITTRFDSSNLTDSERKRILRAFLRFELLCKVGYTREYPTEFDLDVEQLGKYGGRCFRPSDQEAIRCVQKYVESLYGAMFAHCRGSWLPEIAESSPPVVPGLLYPDDVYVNAGLYARDMGLQDHCAEFLADLVKSGFDLVTVLLRSATGGRRKQDALQQWFSAVHKSVWNDDPLHVFEAAGLSLNAGPGRDGGGSPIDDQDLDGPGMYRMLYSRIADSFPLHWSAYRQRAWAFLDNQRLYPSAAARPHFPTEDELAVMSGELALNEEWFANPMKARAARRSQGWHDELHGRLSDDVDVDEPEDCGSDSECKVQVLVPAPEGIERFGKLPPFWR